MTEDELAAFNRGYLIACCNLANIHNEPCIASDVLRQACISAAEVRAMDLSEYDAKALREIRRARADDPIKDTAASASAIRAQVKAARAAVAKQSAAKRAILSGRFRVD